MVKAKRTAGRKGPRVSTGEANQMADERVQRRMYARAKRIRRYVRAVDREFHKLEGDIEGFAMSVLHDRGFVVVGKTQHNALIDENASLHLETDRLERLLATALATEEANAHG
jgi:hypothetical protein